MFAQDVSLYWKLQSVTVLETDGMRTTMILVQNGKKIKVPSSRVQLKFEDADEQGVQQTASEAAASRVGEGDTSDSDYSAEHDQESEEGEDHGSEDELVSQGNLSEAGSDDDEVWEGFDDEINPTVQQRPSEQGESGSCTEVRGLRLFVPASQKERQACYRSQLPGEFARILGVSDGRAMLPISQLLNMQQMSCTESDILQEQDIPQISWISPPATFSQVRSPSPVAELLSAPATESAPLSARSETSGTSNPSSDQVKLAVATSASQEQVYRPAIPVTQVPTVDYTENYRRLLDSIIRKVRSHGKITDGAGDRWDLTGVRDALPETVDIYRLKDETFGVRSQDQLAHDMRIGAAGELYVSDRSQIYSRHSADSTGLRNASPNGPRLLRGRQLEKFD